MSAPGGGRLVLVVFGGVAAWAVHFLGSYALVGMGCAAGWPGLRTMLAAATLVLAALAAAAAVASWRGWRAVETTEGWAAALAETDEWRTFLLLAGILLGALAAGTILVEGLLSLSVPVCSRSGPA